MAAISTRHLLLYYTDPVVAVTITAPAACPGTLDTAVFTFTWSFAPGTQLSYRLDFYNDEDGLDLAWTTGLVTSANKQHELSAGDIEQGQTYWFRVTVFTTDGDTGESVLCQVTAAFGTSVDVTGVTLQTVDACDAPTVLPCVKVSWDVIVEGAGETFVRYEVLRRKHSGEDWITIAQITDIDTLEYHDCTTEAYVRYEYAVRWIATDVGGNTLTSGLPESASLTLTALSLGPAGYWILGEAAGDAIDSSPNGNDGTVTIGAGARAQPRLTPYDDGHLSLEFDGADTRVNVGSPAVLGDIFSGGGTYVGWINAATAGEGGNGRVFDKLTAGFVNGILAQVHALAGGFMKLRFGQSFTGGLAIWDTTAALLEQAVDTHFAIAYDNSLAANVPIFYLDAAPFTVGSGLTELIAPAGVPVSDAANDLLLGNHVNLGDTWDGLQQHVLFYPRILTPAEISLLFNASRYGGPPPTARLEFDFNWIHLHEGDRSTQALRIDAHEIEMGLVADVAMRSIAGRSKPTAFIGEEFFQTIRIPALSRHFSELSWWNKLLELIESQQDTGAVLVLRMGRLRQRYFVATLGGRRRNTQRSYGVDVNLTEVFFEEDLGA